jgi:antitoxin (DNA-binding transcriptional repressor) of toxin-antitoxin stability system
MRHVSALDVRKRLGQLLDEASAGERIVIERDRKPLAMLVPYEEGMRLVESEHDRIVRSIRALERLDRFVERIAMEHPETVGGPDAATLVREMREERMDQIEDAIRPRETSTPPPGAGSE